MKILHINYFSAGGAARAMLRLHSGLLACGEESQFVTCDGVGGPSDGQASSMLSKLEKRILPRLDRLPLKLYARRHQVEFNLQWVPGSVLKTVKELKPDIVHLHWICRAFVRVEDFTKFDRPIVWTLHDCWTFTGGCHYPYNCTRYQQGCGVCPQLGSTQLHDLSHWLWHRKNKAWKNVSMTLVSPSRWLASCTSLSPLLKDKPLEVIPNGLDTDMFKPADRSVSRELLGLPQEKRLLLFGALSPLATEIKGFHFLKPALVEVFKHIQPDFLELIIVGASEPREPIDLGIPVRYMGRLHDDISLRLAYSAADVTVLPSIQEVFGQMASESLACGTPVVAFSGTGIADVIDHGENGYLATAYDESDLGRGIIFILNHPDRTSLQHSARSKAMREFSLPIIAERYRSLYRQVLQQNLRDYGPGKPSMTRAGDII